MISLLYKELLVQKRVLGMAFLYIFVFSFAMKNLGEQLPLAIITAVSYMFVLYGGAWDEKASSDRLWNSLPVPKWKIVGAKYLSVLVYVAGVAVLTWAVFAVLSMVGMGGISTPVRLEHAAGAAISVVGVSSIYLPVYFALGYMKSRMFNLLMMLATFSLPWLLSDLLVNLPAWAAFLEKTRPVGALGLVAAFVVLLAALSFLVALKLYARREF